MSDTNRYKRPAKPSPDEDALASLHETEDENAQKPMNGNEGKASDARLSGSTSAARSNGSGWAGRPAANRDAHPATNGRVHNLASSNQSGRLSMRNDSPIYHPGPQQDSQRTARAASPTAHPSADAAHAASPTAHPSADAAHAARDTSQTAYDASQPLGKNAARHSKTRGAASNDPYSRYAQPQTDEGFFDMGNKGSKKKPAKKQHRGLKIFLIIIVIVLVVGGICGYGGYKLYKSAMTVKAEASSVMESITTLQSDITSGNTADIPAIAQDVATKSASMHAETNNQLWNLAAKIPVYGEDVQKVQTITATLDDFSSNALVPLSDTLGSISLSSLIKDDKSIDVASLQALISSLNQVSPVIQRTTETFDNMGASNIEQLNPMIEKARDKFDKLNKGVQEASALTPYLTKLLGADGQTRNYLIMAQNNVEIRATGGYPGALGVLSITDGKISLGDFVSTMGTVTGLAEGEELSITDEEENLFTTSLSNFMGNVNMTPDFPRAAELAQQMWNRHSGMTVDGVIAIDPVFLQSVLALTGSVTMSNGTTLDGTNAAKTLMHDTYWNYPEDQQDAFFAEAAALSFNSLMNNLGKVSLTKLLSTINQSAADHRVQVWMANADEEKVFKKYKLTGEIETDPTNPVLGIYVDDYTWSKIDWYLSLNTQIGEGIQNEDGSTSYQVTTTLTNHITDEEAKAASDYIRGYNPQKNDISDMMTKIFFFAPAGGSISDMQTQGGNISYGMAYESYEGLGVCLGLMHDLAGETTTFTYTVTTSPQATSMPTVRTTPDAQTVAGW